MNKKIISLVLALVMVLGTFTSVFAEAATKADAKKEEVKKTETKKAEAGEKVEKVVGKDNKIQYVVDKKFVEGYEDGNLGLDKNIKRSEITRLLVLANGNEELAKKLQGSMKIYSDVDAKHWANGVISVGTTVPSDANGIAMLAGYPDGSFKPENDVTYAELAKMLVVLAKKDLTADMVKNAKWATSWMTWAAQLGILDDVTITDSNKAANRADAFTMIYNALYKMAEFKRTPANEVRGIVSDLNRSKIVLNQDSKKEFTVTAETVIVNGMNERAQIIKLSNINRLDVYAGSLVRILTNDKNEVTHIIELGNPKVLARGIEAGAPAKNNVWQGVADNTVETAYYENIVSLKDVDQRLINKEYATVELNGAKTSASTITFHYGVNKTTALNINDKTEVYVANPWNNIMRQVKDVNEALSLIGFHNYNGYKIPNVYAGFDSTRYNAAVKTYMSTNNTAKVIVFNVVSKDAGYDKYRVVESSSSKFKTTLEKTDGTIVDRDNVLNKAHFALNYGDKLDVIGLRGDAITTLLDHSDLREFPVVKVAQIFDDNNVQVVDRFGKETTLYLGDADKFNEKQYKDLKVGDFLQFVAAEKNARKIEILSVLPRLEDSRVLFDKSGTLLNVVQGIDANVAVGKVMNVQKEGNRHFVEIMVEEANWDAGLARTPKLFEVSKDYAEALDNLYGVEVKFNVNIRKNERNDWAYNFLLNDGKDTPVLKKVAEKNETAIEIVERLAKTGAVTATEKGNADNQITAETSVSKSNALQKRLDAALKLNAEKAVENYVAKALNADFKSTLLLAEETKATTAINFLTAAGVKAALNAKVTDAKDVRTDYDAVVAATINNVDKTDLAPAAVQTDLTNKVKALAAKNTVETVELTNLPKDNGRYAAAAELKAKVTFKKGDAKMAANIEACIVA